MTLSTRLSSERLRSAFGGLLAPSAQPAAAPSGRFPPLEDVFPGRVLQTAAGPCFVAESSFPVAHQHGRYHLIDGAVLGTRAAACLTRDPSVCPPDMGSVVFLDTETTGLSGGTGTYVFLVGLGAFEGESFVIRQYLMRDYTEEDALLEALAAVLPSYDAAVTFNGKSFDLPLIETRFLASRRQPPRRARLHLDLLFPARRLWRQQLEHCTLTDLERAVLGHQRDGDLPSWMVPTAYFRYVREGDVHLLGQVLEHNVQDILSLVALVAHLSQVFEEPLGNVRDAGQLLMIADAYIALGYQTDAMVCLERALNTPPDSVAPAVYSAIASRLARLCLQSGQPDRAEELWRRAARIGGPGGLASSVALAKFLEHQRRDYLAARIVVEQAIARLELWSRRREAGWELAERGALEHRLARLIARQAGTWNHNRRRLYAQRSA